MRSSQKFLRDGPTPEELARVKVQDEAAFIRGAERIGGFGGKSDILASSQVYLGSPDAYKISEKRIHGAAAEDLREAARRWLSDGVYILEVFALPGATRRSFRRGKTCSKMPDAGTPPELKLPKAAENNLSANGLESCPPPSGTIRRLLIFP